MRILPFALLLFYVSFSQTNYPKDFRPPLDIPMQLAGNFGELRPNHFHAGFDFRTNQQEGLNVYAAGDGYVSRIKISTVGYGKAIYITHPNGYTTVYGHLQKAVGEIQKRIIDYQYQEKNYEVELFLKPSELPVKKGDIIAISGNTGGSEGPHLHFEFRDSKTEKVVNPLFFGFDKLIKDTKKPIVSSLFVYPIDENATVNQSKRPVNLNMTLQPDGTYLSEKIYADGNIGLGITGSDSDNVSNNNGIYKTQLISNGKSIFGYEFDEMVFDEARYVNAFIDYYRYKKLKQRVQKLFFKNPYPWSNIKDIFNNGVFNVTPNYNEIERIEVSDFYNNKTIISVPIEFSFQQANVISDIKKTPYFIKANRDALFEKDNVTVSFPAGTFYDDFYLNFDINGDLLTLGEDAIAAHSNFSILYETKGLSDAELDKTIIVSVNGNKMTYLNTKRNGATLSTKTKYLGQFKLAKDITDPKIVMQKWAKGKSISNQKNVSVYISDDLSGVKSYNGYLNGKWILMEYEPKLHRLTHNFTDGIVTQGTNELKVIVVDNVGNSATFETQFNRN
jgi:murein DD-endopeptidase MepM/ murein hydrolase activator NlpD